MRINGKPGAGARSTKDRKRTTGTKPERRLQSRIEGYNVAMRVLRNDGTGPLQKGYHRPGSLQAS